MKAIQLTNPKGDKITFTIPSNGVQWVIHTRDKGHTAICDEVHNNGGWTVTESIAEIIALLEII
jgi:hypothetical protein